MLAAVGPTALNSVRLSNTSKRKGWNATVIRLEGRRETDLEKCIARILPAMDETWDGLPVVPHFKR